MYNGRSSLLLIMQSNELGCNCPLFAGRDGEGPDAWGRIHVQRHSYVMLMLHTMIDSFVRVYVSFDMLKGETHR